MKLSILLLLSLVIYSCDNDDDLPSSPLDQLPAATSSGENTLGCLVNGEPYIINGRTNSFYQFVSGDRTLAINSSQRMGQAIEGLRIVIRNIEIIQNQTYTLNKNGFGNQSFSNGGMANYYFSEDPTIGGADYFTDNQVIGSIQFTRFDDTENIMSGTFEFQAQESITGEIINITDGRFDLQFTN